MSLSCIIVDDERLAQNVLEKYVSALPSLKLLKKCSTALEAIAFMHENRVDLIFLDIDMPEISGLEMLKSLNSSPKVILTTAYSEYAIESYEYGVVDYLLKPIAFDRFLKSVNRVIDLNLDKPQSPLRPKSPDPSGSMILRQDGKQYKVHLKDILYIEAYGNYLNVYTTEKKYIIREKLHIIEKSLPAQLFVRTHKSYIVSLDKISSITGNRVMINDISIPIGNYYKSELDKRFKGS